MGGAIKWWMSAPQYISDDPNRRHEFGPLCRFAPIVLAGQRGQYFIEALLIRKARLSRGFTESPSYTLFAYSASFTSVLIS